MLVLVTGCGGFLGRHVTAQLLARGNRVRGLARGDYPAVSALGVDVRRGDITDPTGISNACRGVDAVIHCAAIAGVWGPWERYHSINTVGTQNVIEACRRHAVPILVHCSSPSVTFDGSDQSGVDESVPYPANYLCHYSRTKALAEQAVLAAHRAGTLHTAALRPHLIWGGDDPHLFPRLVARARSGRLRIVGNGDNRIDTVHVENAAAAHLNALDHLTQSDPVGGGRAFFITQDEPVRCWDWIAEVLRIADVLPPKRRISLATAWRIGATLETLYRLAGIRQEPPMTRFLAAQLARDHYFDISAAKQVLGYRPSLSTAEGLGRLRADWNASPA